MQSLEVKHVIAAELPDIAPGIEMCNATFLVNPLMGDRKGQIGDEFVLGTG